MNRSTLLPRLLLVAAVAVTVVAGSRMLAQEPSVAERRAVAPSFVWDAGVQPPAIYTDSQATEGQAVFAKSCAECHESKDVTGADFRTKWGGQPIFTLYEQVRTTMPDGNPGTLTREQYAAAIAYILKLNGLPSGPTPMGTDSTSLSAVKLELPAVPPASRP